MDFYVNATILDKTKKLEETATTEVNGDTVYMNIAINIIHTRTYRIQSQKWQYCDIFTHNPLPQMEELYKRVEKHLQWDSGTIVSSNTFLSLSMFLCTLQQFVTFAGKRHGTIIFESNV